MKRISGTPESGEKMTQNNFQIDSAAVSDRGLSEKRPQNEDSFLEMNERGLFAVADGVGGAQAGDVASQMAVEILSEAFANLPENGDAEEMMRLAIERANESIFQMSHDLPQLATMATTIVALHISGNIATIGHVGDSRLYRLDTNGNIYRETGDHSVVEEEVRAGRMTSAQAAHHPNRNIISRAVGADSTVEVDMKTIMFEPHATFFLCSDGITRHIEDAEIRSLLLSGETPSSVVQKMKEICYERGAEDNLTAVIAKITDSAAVGFASAKASMLTSELEESTVITPRRNALIAEDAPAEEIQTGELQTPLTVKSAPFETVETIQTATAETAAVSATSVPVENTETAPIAENNVAINNVAVNKVVENKTEDDVKSYRVDEGNSGFLGKILSALMWLIIGGIAFAGLNYLFLQNNKAPEAPVLTEMQTPNIEYTAFENNRRNVDKNPKGFIAANVAAPDDAEDLYLLGRAYLLEGNFPAAKQMFVRAKERLGQTGEVNGNVLANDIEIGSIAAGVPAAQDALKKMSESNNTNAGSSINSNIAVNQSPNQPDNSAADKLQTP